MARDPSSGVLIFGPDLAVRHIDPAAVNLLNTDRASLLNGTAECLHTSLTTPEGDSYPSLLAYVEKALTEEAPASTVVLSARQQAEIRVAYGPDGPNGVVVTVHPPPADDRSRPSASPRIGPTEWDDTDETLREHRDLLHRTQEMAHVGGWVYNPKTDVMKGTDETYRICGVPLNAELTLDEALSLYPDETADRIRVAAMRCLTKGTPFDAEGPMVTPEGASRWVRVRGEARRDDDGAIARMVGTVQDLSERHAIEERLREQKEWLQSITENISGGIYRSTEEGLVYANQALLDLFGYESLSEMASADPDAFYAHPEVRDELMHRETGQDGLTGVEVEYRRKDGTTFTGLLRSTQVVGDDGTTKYYDGVVTDITEQKKREEKLRAQGQKMNSLYETTERLLSADTPGTVADRIQHLLDEAFAYPFMGVSFVEDGRILPERVTLADGYDVPPVQPLDVDGESLAARALRSGKTVTIEDFAADPSDNSYGDLRSAVCVPIGEAGVIYVGHTEPGPFESFDLHLIDVLAKKAAAVLVRIEREQQLKATKQKAEEASRLKSALLANMSHEIRTPLTSIIGFAGLLESNLSGQDARYAELVHHGGERLMDTLDSVLQLSKLEAGVIEPSSDDIDLVAKAREAVELYRQRAETARIALHFEPATESLVGAWDATAVHRVLSNLLSNALKFTPEGGTVTVGVHEHDERAVVTVTDTGIGIGDEFRTRLFDAFTQESDGLEREHEGSGLGLAIVSRLVDLLDGEIDVESTKGEGTCFRVVLPLPPADGSSTSSN